MCKSSISKATSYEEIGEFWDTHGVTDYWELTEPCEFTVVSKLRHVYISNTPRRSGMTVQEAIDQRIAKIRLPHWAEGSHVSFDFLEDDKIGPWAHVKDPSGSVDIFVSTLLEDTSSDWEEFKESI